MGPKIRKDKTNGVNGGSGGGGGEKTASSSKDLEQLQADYELFLQAFEKPTQIYRYLRTRNLTSPIFLHRNLTFMKSRIRRKNTARLKGFKVDSLLERKLKEVEVASVPQSSPAGFLTLTFLGYYDKKTNQKSDKVSIEVFLVKMSHKKRKESASQVDQVSLGSSEIPVNPSEENPPKKAPALSIPAEAFSLSNGHQIKSYSLIVKVRHLSLQNGEENQEPASKRSRNGGGGENEDEEKEDGEEGEEEGVEEEIGSSSSSSSSAELFVYDKHSRCLLTEGEYELLMVSSKKTEGAKSPKKNNSTWENISAERVKAQEFDVFTSLPTLKFRLSWSSEPAGSMVERPRPLMSRDENSVNNCNNSSSNHNGTTTNNENGGDSSAMILKNLSSTISTSVRVVEKPPRIVYQFLYNNNSRQQTEAREDLHCPWCSLNCMELYALLKHLKLSHPRFLFTYVPIPEGARIDVSVSELYDSTYVGNPHDMISQPPGFAFSRYGPVQRTSITNILVCKPKRQPVHSLSEFLEIDDNDLNGPYADGQRPFVTGHNRLYHYSTTCLPMPPSAILQPSTEDEVDPPWLMIKICKMLDEFSDVNDGEKEFMKIWNLHVQHHTYVGDCRMSSALQEFIEDKGEEVVEKNLYRNFVLHVCNLFDFGVIGPAYVFTAITYFQEFIKRRNLRLKFHRSLWQQQQQQQQHNNHQQRKDFSGIFKN